MRRKFLAPIKNFLVKNFLLFTGGQKSRRQTRKFLNQEGGSAAVEAVLILPLYLLMTFGILEFGWLNLVHVELETAANDATRILKLSGVGIIRGQDTADENQEDVRNQRESILQDICARSQFIKCGDITMFLGPLSNVQNVSCVDRVAPPGRTILDNDLMAREARSIVLCYTFTPIAPVTGLMSSIIQGNNTGNPESLFLDPTMNFGVARVYVRDGEIRSRDVN